MMEVKISKGPESIMVDEKEEYVRKIERLEKKLELATKALKKYESAAGWGREAFLALKEMEGVK